jgi:hypothetical protein
MLRQCWAADLAIIDKRRKSGSEVGRANLIGDV